MFEKYQKLALKRHNDLRKLHHDTPPMELDADLCREAEVCLAKYNTY